MKNIIQLDKCEFSLQEHIKEHIFYLFYIYIEHFAGGQNKRSK